MQSALEMPSRWAFGGALRKPVPASECRLASRPVYQRGCSTAPAGEPAEPPAGAAAVLGCGQARHHQPARHRPSSSRRLDFAIEIPRKFQKMVSHRKCFANFHCERHVMHKQCFRERSISIPAPFQNGRSPFSIAELCVPGRGAGILLAPALITAIVPPRAPSGWIYYSTLLRVWRQYLKW